MVDGAPDWLTERLVPSGWSSGSEGRVVGRYGAHGEKHLSGIIKAADGNLVIGWQALHGRYAHESLHEVLKSQMEELAALGRLRDIGDVHLGPHECESGLACRELIVDELELGAQKEPLAYATHGRHAYESSARQRAGRGGSTRTKTSGRVHARMHMQRAAALAKREPR